MNTSVTLRAAEWVLPGHPDKLADAVADALVQAAQQRQPEALCAIEVAVHREQVFLTGRLACEGADAIPIEDLVREVYRTAGYGPGEGNEPGRETHEESAEATSDAPGSTSGKVTSEGRDHRPVAPGPWRPAPQDVVIGGNLCIEPLVPGEEGIRHISDDQSIVTGYAVDLPGIGFIPPEQWLAREVARRLFALVGSDLQLCPDGKVLVVLEEEGDAPGSIALPPAPGHHGGSGNSGLPIFPGLPKAWRLHAVSCSLLAQAGDVELHRAALQAVRQASQELARRLPGFEPGDPHEFVVNGSGTFSIGGPEGDNGLSGKKLLLDHYGPRVPIGGTALSGKDFWKPDRAGTLLARRLALAVVHAGVAREAVVQFVSFPGDEAPRLVRITTPQGDLPDASRWLQLLNCRFETTRAWGQCVDLVERARWGWFGVDAGARPEEDAGSTGDVGLAWERLGLR
jgi:S-adenosylmethionine synthetase